MTCNNLSACQEHARTAFFDLMASGPLPGDSLTIDSRSGCWWCRNEAA
jgi:hypothetical protein